MSVAATHRVAATRLPAVGSALVLAASAIFLLVRLVPDVRGKPLHEDEAVAGLVSARPLGELLQTVLVDRGGAPLHFLLAHVALVADPSPDGLRWLSVVFALATIPLCYDLGRRLAGTLAGGTAAALAGTSQLLAIYGTFGRMYSLLAFASALAADLFVRALDRPSRTTALAAAAGALLPLAVHPFGVFLLGAEAAVALWLWRGKPLRPALPALTVSLLALPLLLADLRLSDRYAPEAGGDVVSASSAAGDGLRALGGAAGGLWPTLGAFAVLAAVGAVTLLRRGSAFPAFACLAIVVPPTVLAVAGETGIVTDRLSPRHLLFVLPLWIALVATGVDRVVTPLRPQLRMAVVAAVLVVAALAPAAVSDPRSIPSGEGRALAAPAAWLRAHVGHGDVLYPYSPVFLAALPSAADSRSLPREAVALARAARRTPTPTGSVFISVPLQNGFAAGAVRALQASRAFEAHLFPSWLLLEVRGPFSDGSAVLAAAARALSSANSTVRVTTARAYLDQLHGTACQALARLGDARCP